MSSTTHPLVNAFTKPDPPAGHPVVRIGVFLPYGSQLLDMATVDTFGTMSYEYMASLSAVIPLPPGVLNLAPSVQIFYIGKVAKGEPIAMTASVSIIATHNMADPEVQPGKLDIVLIPGMDPGITIEKEVAEWLRRHAETEGVDILSVCTGIFLCGEAGLLKGKQASGPRGMQDMIKSRFEGVKLVGDEYRWTNDGNFWSSGGVTNGNDLVAAYARQSKHFPRSIADLGCSMTDVGDRPQKYSVGQTRFMTTMMWLLLKSWVLGSLGFGKGGKSKSS